MAATSASLAPSPTSRLFVSMPSTIATAMSSSADQQRADRVPHAVAGDDGEADAESANTRPVSAATSSSSTTGSSGALARRMNCGHDMPALCGRDSLHRRAQRERLEADRDQQHQDRAATQFSSGCGCVSFSKPS